MSFFNIKGRPHLRQGFTLIELLVVIVIIGILATLILVGGTAARKTVRQGLIRNEITGIDGALENYRRIYGEYPPDFSDKDAVMRHVRKRWPNFNWFNQNQDFAGFCKLVNIATGYDFTTVSEHGVDKSRGAHIGALAFWLGGIPNESIGMLGGFSADVTSPLGLVGSGSSDPTFTTITQWDSKSQFLDLNLGKNCDVVDDLPVVISNGYPIAYFKASAAGKYLQKGTTNEALCFHFHFSNPEWSDLSIGVPYAKVANNGPEDAVWHNPKSFQLIHPGIDKKFSVAENNSPAEFRVIDPSKDVRQGLTLEDDDNQANFGGNTIETSGN